MKGIYGDGNPGGIKVLLSHLWLCQNVVRLPLAPVNKQVEENIKTLAAELQLV